MLGIPTEVWIGGFSALGGGLITKIFDWLLGYKSQKITDASKLTDMAQTVVQSYDQLVTDLREQLETQQEQIEGLQSQQLADRVDISILQDENEQLARQIEALHDDYESLAEKYQDCQKRLERCPECKKDDAKSTV